MLGIKSFLIFTWLPYTLLPIASITIISVYFLGITPGSFYGGPVHKFNPDSKDVTMNFIAGTYYSIAVDQAEDEIYVTDVKQFTADGEVQIYKKDGTLEKFFTAQMGPSVIVFKR